MAAPPSIRVVRPRDLLILDFEFDHLRLEADGETGEKILVEPSVGVDHGLMIVLFPAQALAERAFFQRATLKPSSILVPTTSDSPPGPTAMDLPVRALLGGRSRLTFVVPRDVEIPFTVNGLLTAMRTLELHVVNVAQQPAPQVAFAAGRLTARSLAEQLFDGSAAVGARTRAAVVGRHRLLRTSATLAGRFGVLAAIDSLSALATEPLLGRLRADVGRGGVTGLGGGEIPPPDETRIPQDPWAGSETAIELPFRLLLSPQTGAAWVHDIAPVNHDGRIELWHTRLGQRVVADVSGEAIVDELTADARARAVWTRDFELGPKPFSIKQQALPVFSGDEDKPPKSEMRMSLSARDRISIVHQTSNFALDCPPPAIDVDHLMLSSLGGSLDSHVEWARPPGGFDLEEWRHVATLGRDHFVRVVYGGFLFPFGHRASLVKVTERKFAPKGSAVPAYLFQRMFVVVREPTRIYPKDKRLTLADETSVRDDQRLELLFPFTTVRLTTLITPDLDEPTHLRADPEDLAMSPGMSDADEDALKELLDELDPHPLFFPTVDTVPFAFKCVAVDLDGQLVEFRTPLLFMSKALNDDPSLVPLIRRLYEQNANGRGTAELVGQSVALAPSSGERADDTRVDVSELHWTGELLFVPGPATPEVNVIPPPAPRFAPVMTQATVVIPAVRQIAGKSESSTVAYAPQYGKHGFTGQNPGELFLEMLKGPAMDFEGQSDRSGGLVAPSFALSGLSRKAGPMGGSTETIAKGSFQPSEVFEALNAMLFGVIPLAELIKEAGFDEPIKVPSFVSETVNTVTTLMSMLDRAQRMLTTLVDRDPSAEWHKDANDVIDDAAALTVLIEGGGAQLELQAAIDTLSKALVSLTGTLPTQTDPAITSLLSQLGQFLANATNLAELIEALEEGFQLPESVSARIEWEPDIKPWGLTGTTKEEALFWPHGADTPDLAGPGTGRLALVVDMRGSTGNGLAAAADISCSLEEFDLQLIAPHAFMELDFTRIRFSAQAGRKPDVEVVFNEIRFVGVLSFVETLRELIPLDGFSDPPSLDVSPTGITAAFSLPLPTIAVGVFSLQNLALGANLRVPFVGEPLQVGFSFCTREAPFRLTVSLFGGGGFFGVTLQPDGVRMLEASFEFGAAVSLDFGVASGSLSVMAGIYFRMEGRDASLTGYFQARGEAEILGIVSMSIELYLGLTYEFATGKAVGRASIMVEVEVLCFSASVEITCERKFSGANADPTFGDLLDVYTDPRTNQTLRPWDEYCAAFAAVS